MLNKICMLTLLIGILLMGSDNTGDQSEDFISLERTNLRSMIDLGVRQGRAKQTRFWTAYSFDVRPGVAVDVEIRNGDGSTTIVSGTSISVGSNIETRNLGVFSL